MASVGEILAAFEALPLVDLEALVGGASVLVIAPHADDESLGCGGLIAEACRQGRPPVVVVLTDGVGSHPNSLSYPPARLRAVREREAREATACLGLPAERLHFLGLPDTRAPTAGPEFDRAVAEVGRLAERGGCGVVVAPWRYDPHCDHVAADAIAAAASSVAGFRHLAYPIWGWTLPRDAERPVGLVRGARLDIAPHLVAKRRAIASHASQYFDLITDDPDGFRLPPGLLGVFERPYEVFVEAA